MRKTICSIFMLGFAFLMGQEQKNILLDNAFWKKSPSIELLKSEIAKGNNPSEANDHAVDAVSMAINNNASLESIKYLLDQPGNDINKATHDAKTYLHWAAAASNLELCQYLLQKGAKPMQEDAFGQTPLPAAAMAGLANPEIYKLFFEKGVKATSKYQNGASILLLSAGNDPSLALQNFLVSQGLSVKEVDAQGAGLFDYAAKHGNIDLLKKIIETGAKPSSKALLMAATATRKGPNKIELYQFLIEQLALNPKVSNKDGEGILHLMANKAAQSEIVKYLISKGLDAQLSDKDGNTPLMVAVKNREETSTLALLISETKNLNAKNLKGQSALMLAMQYGMPESVEMLIKNGADVQQSDAKGNGLSFYWMQSYRSPKPGMKTDNRDRFAEKQALLQANGINLSKAQADGNTLFHLAMLKNDLKLFEKIASLGADINAINKDGFTVLHKAALLAKDDAVLKYLVNLGANKNIKTEMNEMAYDLAKENQYLSSKNIDINFLK